ncbi:hypothetical protein LEP1GSC106_4970 [Leptospira interrogans serovar Grippotyphosa str. UI 12764]|nr:hypothetical protein LEP1GSC106_4970 [Leptospira interrogans serovar Grippotyphosa str. UI 12764]
MFGAKQFGLKQIFSSSKSPNGIKVIFRVVGFADFCHGCGAQRLPASKLYSDPSRENSNTTGSCAQRLPTSKLYSAKLKTGLCGSGWCSTPNGIPIFVSLT